MTTSVRITNHIPDFNAALLAALPKAVANAAEVYVSGAQQIMQRTGGRGVGKGVAYNVPSRPGEPPAVQQGTLRRSVTRSSVQNLRAKVGTAYAIGKYMEFGANPAGKGKKLSVPLTQEAARASGPRSMDLHVLPRKGKNTLLVDKSGKPQFVLVDSVTIRPRPWLRPTMKNRELHRTAQAVIADTIRRAVVTTAKAGAA